MQFFIIITIILLFQNNQTALHVALLRGHKDIAELLISKGANMEIEDEVGFLNPV